MELQLNSNYKDRSEDNLLSKYIIKSYFESLN